MQRKINFNAGPAALPADVLQEAAEAVKQYKDTGLSILELPHRGKEFISIVDEGTSLVKELCSLNDDYHVLWLQGGGRMQFCMIPMNFLPQDGNAGYIDSGRWAEEAREYAAYYGDAHLLASSKDVNYSRLPTWPSALPEGLSYIHYTTNNTIFGTQWHHIPPADAPLIADMSSDIFSRAHDYSRYALFYAAVQKNLGTPGVALVVLHKNLLEKTCRDLPPMLSYRAQVKENSILNTANVFGVYVSLLMLRWTKAKGIATIEKENTHKAAILYDAIERNKKFKLHVTEKSDRSLMNVCFTAVSPDTERSFISLCTANNIVGVEGHRFVGGFRVSLYNGVTVEDVETLVKLVNEF